MINIIYGQWESMILWGGRLIALYSLNIMYGQWGVCNNYRKFSWMWCTLNLDVITSRYHLHADKVYCTQYLTSPYIYVYRNCTSCLTWQCNTEIVWSEKRDRDRLRERGEQRESSYVGVKSSVLYYRIVL